MASRHGVHRKMRSASHVRKHSSNGRHTHRKHAIKDGKRKRVVKVGKKLQRHKSQHQNEIQTKCRSRSSSPSHYQACGSPITPAARVPQSIASPIGRRVLFLSPCAVDIAAVRPRDASRSPSHYQPCSGSSSPSSSAPSPAPCEGSPVNDAKAVSESTSSSADATGMSPRTLALQGTLHAVEAGSLSTMLPCVVDLCSDHDDDPHMKSPKAELVKHTEVLLSPLTQVPSRLERDLEHTPSLSSDLASESKLDDSNMSFFSDLDNSHNAECDSLYLSDVEALLETEAPLVSQQSPLRSVRNVELGLAAGLLAELEMLSGLLDPMLAELIDVHEYCRGGIWDLARLQEDVRLQRAETMARNGSTARPDL